MKRFGWFLPVMFLVISCGKNTPQWPARLVGVQNFSEEQKQEVMAAVGKLNEQLGHQAILTDSQGEGYPITIRLVTAPPDNGKRAGLATVSDSDCNIDISTLCFTPQYEGVLTPVVIHELGHCAGLKHVEEDHEIMSPVTHPVSQYDASAWTRFFRSFLEAARL